MKLGFLLFITSLWLAGSLHLLMAADPPRPAPAPALPPPVTGESRGSEFSTVVPPLPAGTYHAVTASGVRLSGVIASSGDTSFSKMPMKREVLRRNRAEPKGRIVDPGLKFERR